MMLFKYNYNYIVITAYFSTFLSSYNNIFIDKLLFTPPTTPSQCRVLVL